ncbi:ABC transporter ATP-binding protein [Kocuria marina]|uniref:Energy-coupling factor transport system ATP-binding protein n=1 Tax=Kocuria marina subsp. indica TaxID=1049583 RepID=A0A1X7CBY0_9MICC|nr:ABC transporter ATP-binding protein [Kocuria indica]OXS85399.1 ABC transporter ATP-binding protein [Kocuria indica]RLP59071.1 ATP-binding cassette domain-containing protein [Kocuria indica]SME93244.1 energy-coupling factor transport system ATP-binding protein [Kocuria indica]
MTAESTVQLTGARVVLEGFGWHHPGRETPSLVDLDLIIEPGERVLLLGPSGAGKSTLLQALAGVDQDPDGRSASGGLTVGGVDPRDARGTVGFMHQDPETQVVLSRVGDDVAFGLENLAVPRERIWPRVREALARTGLELLLDHPTTALSGGQKQRLALAGTLAMCPRLLLLDEPTASVDHEGAQQLCRAVADAVREDGTTLVVVEHRVALWEPVVDRVIVLGDDGRVAFDGPAQQTLQDARELLQHQGTWVPGWVPRTRTPVHASNGMDPAVRQTAVSAAPHDITPPAAPTENAPAASSMRASDVAESAQDTGGFATVPAAVAPGTTLLSARDLAVSRSQPGRRALARRRRRALAAWRRGEAYPEPDVRTGAAPAAENITVDVRAGHALAVTGVNGAGKSTLALTLAGLLLPVRGTVWATDALATDAPADPSLWDGAELVSRVGTVFQHPEHQFLRPTVREELEFGPRQRRRRVGRRDARVTDAMADADDARVAELLRRLRLEELAEANPFTLSGGQKRRLSVGTVLAASPRVLILDEPTFGQDARTWKELVDLLVEELDGGTAVVVVTHDRDLVAALGAYELRLGS